MEEILQQIPVTPQQDSERPNSASFRLLHLTSSSMEFTESDYLPHELNTGGFCICLRGKSRVTLNQHRHILLLQQIPQGQRHFQIQVLLLHAVHADFSRIVAAMTCVDNHQPGIRSCNLF